MDKNNLIQIVNEDFFKITGINLNFANPKWWKIKTSLKSIIQKIYDYKDETNVLKININKEDGKIYINSNLIGISLSSLRQYFVVGYTLGIFKINTEINDYKSFTEFIKDQKVLEFTDYFVGKRNFEGFLAWLDLNKEIRERILWTTPNSFIWEQMMNLIFTIIVYKNISKYKLENLLEEYLKDYKQKENTRMEGAIEEYKSQVQITIAIK
ncbi:hypothetical protein CG006_01715 [Mesoplasma florum]|uniref:hypothetical protein n=1 Tax=Mesoplasma florum TaxID=2151 RepID=UPI000D02ADE8|nr:hypothetical protein [Mesoplasma florum]AVN63694.1 hypothetical protein CG006_01715 [Mesoplasma florum]